MTLPNLKSATYILIAIAVGLIITSFFLPPMGVIDNSALIVAGIFFAFAALLTAQHAIDKGMDAKIKHGETELTITNDEDKEN